MSSIILSEADAPSTPVAGKVVVYFKTDGRLYFKDDTGAEVLVPITADITTAVAGKEPTIAAGTEDQYWKGNKSWQDFATSVRAAVLTGLSTAAGTVVTAGHSVLQAIGFLQKQVSDNTTAIARAPYTLAQSHVASSVTGTLSETTLGSVTIPANAMGPNGSLRIIALFSYTSSANNKIIRMKFGGVNYYGATLTTQSNSQVIAIVRNRNATNSQVGHGLNGVGISNSSASLSTSTVDTTADTTVTFTGVLANVADSITLEGYSIEVMAGA